MNKRAPLIAAIVGVILAVLAVFFLVMPKRAEVSERQDALEQAEAQEQTVQTQLALLQAAKDEAPETNEEIRKIDTLIPPTEDQPGMILLLQSAADRAGVDPLTISPATPTAATDAQFSTMVVTLDTSSSVVVPASALSRPSTYMVRIPASPAAWATAWVEARLRISSRTCSSTSSSSKMPSRPTKPIPSQASQPAAR